MIRETERCYLEKIGQRHRDDIFEYASDSETTRFMSWPIHQTMDNTDFFIDLCREQYEKGIELDFAIVLKKNDKMIGTAGMVLEGSEPDVREIGYIINKKYWGQGIVPEIGRYLMKIGFGEMGLKAIYAHCHPENNQSERVMQKLGMSYQGIFDVKLIKCEEPVPHKRYRILRDEWAGDTLTGSVSGG